MGLEAPRNYFWFPVRVYIFEPEVVLFFLFREYIQVTEITPFVIKS